MLQPVLAPERVLLIEPDAHLEILREAGSTPARNSRRPSRRSSSSPTPFLRSPRPQPSAWGKGRRAEKTGIRNALHYGADTTCGRASAATCSTSREGPKSDAGAKAGASSRGGLGRAHQRLLRAGQFPGADMDSELERVEGGFGMTPEGPAGWCPNSKGPRQRPGTPREGFRRSRTRYEVENYYVTQVLEESQRGSAAKVGELFLSHIPYRGSTAPPRVRAPPRYSLKEKLIQLALEGCIARLRIDGGELHQLIDFVDQPQSRRRFPGSSIFRFVAWQRRRRELEVRNPGAVEFREVAETLPAPPAAEDRVQMPTTPSAVPTRGGCASRTR